MFDKEDLAIKKILSVLMIDIHFKAKCPRD